jgi:hypothetical protein
MTVSTPSALGAVALDASMIEQTAIVCGRWRCWRVYPRRYYYRPYWRRRYWW